ncbi:MAG: phosphohydrolase [Clostridiales bacterium]|nr:phosphohydrolase [Clostridiales bacterium]
MRVFAIGDLHLQGGDNKPMDVFGGHWTGHFDRISADWQEKVGEEDVVLIPGDISWAMQLENALPDLQMIGRLPGIKIILRGNHDYWWSTVTRVRECLPEKMYALQNDALKIGDIVFCGTRGWGSTETADDRKIYKRELMRLEMSLERARLLEGEMIVLCHYPPVDENGNATEVSELISRYPVSHVVYGHLHGVGINVFNGEAEGINYHCVACDQIGFKLAQIK